jgi:hypothetical protein
MHRQVILEAAESVSIELITCGIKKQ